MTAAALCLALLPGATPLASLDVEITGLRSARGLIQLCLTADAAAFPDCKRAGGIRRTLSAAAPRIRFEGLPPGDYAVAVIHDANANAKLDTMLGIPREGFGFSRDPAIRFGPPRFAAAQFTVAAGGGSQQVRMRYLL
ncbi:DUF2141 domain-containing protein [Sphingomonas sp. DG1-23]|uniref:DUF2141 domain-containing protein n=1 Tax=Sphingomonas sp. DG1-23 TaxID=3068316 RepID=UPI00273F3432|nr:DUF2141 domain-containing protein [Sphingomonas sp. DG1-23]MDP5279977.1 DUF2141 domain-containing protein [Sphingomonas sp. DG1-23]